MTRQNLSGLSIDRNFSVLFIVRTSISRHKKDRQNLTVFFMPPINLSFIILKVIKHNVLLWNAQIIQHSNS